MNYTTFKAPSPPDGGLMEPMEGMGPTVLNYILATDIDETQRKIERAGGALIVPKSEIPNFGWFASFRDPAGITQAIYQNMPRPRAAPRRKAKRASMARGRRSKARRRK